MKALLVLLTALFIPPPVLAQLDRSDGNEEAAVMKVIKDTETANNAGDVEMWVSLFSEDAVYMAPGAPAVTTRDGLIEVASAGFRHSASIAIEPVEIQVFGDWAFARNHVFGTVELAGSGEIVAVDVKQLVVYSREPGGDWKIARLISNSNK